MQVVFVLMETKEQKCKQLSNPCLQQSQKRQISHPNKNVVTKNWENTENILLSMLDGVGVREIQRFSLTMKLTQV